MLLVVTAATDFKNVDAHQTKLYLLFFLNLFQLKINHLYHTVSQKTGEFIDEFYIVFVMN